MEWSFRAHVCFGFLQDCSTLSGTFIQDNVFIDAENSASTSFANEDYEDCSPATNDYNPLWSKINGEGCVLEGDCISSIEYCSLEQDTQVGFSKCKGYGSRDHCTVAILEDTNLKFEEWFETEAHYNFLTMDDEKFSGADASPIAKCRHIPWKSDGSISSRGWTVCKSQAPWAITGGFDCVVDGEMITGNNYKAPEFHSSIQESYEYGNWERCTVDI